MITVPGISAGNADVARSLLATTADAAVSTGARAAASGAKRTGDVEAWTFQRVEDVESLLALLEDLRKHGTLGQDAIHAVDRLIATLTAACRA
ncbi:MAG: hypothetical protein Q7W02_13620 [Candidatus Rokubacteria bacterium]|nr:hypothetical protein [Candidatus Rokubacteria bacterium]